MFTAIAMQGFGGVVAVLQRELVERKAWMTQEEFAQEWAIAQILPGSNVVNLSILVGTRFFGAGGALAAVAGMLSLPLAVAMGVALLQSAFSGQAQVQAVLRGVAAAAAGFTAAVGLALAGTLLRHPLGLWTSLALGLATFAAVALLRWPLAPVVFVIGGVSWVLTWRRLGAGDAP